MEDEQRHQKRINQNGNGISPTQQKGNHISKYKIANIGDNAKELESLNLQNKSVMIRKTESLLESKISNCHMTQHSTTKNASKYSKNNGCVNIHSRIITIQRGKRNEILIYVIKSIKLEDMLSENSETIHHVFYSLLYKIFIISGVGK